MNKVAICVMTHNHPGIVKKLCENICPLYDKYGVDMILYDSSANRDSFELYLNAKRKGTDNLYYVRVEDTSISCGNEKIRLCLQGYGQIKEYDYIMPIKDRAVLLDKALESIQKIAELEFDAIVLEAYKVEYFLDEVIPCGVYENPQMLFKDYAVLLTDWQTCLFGKRLRENIEWEEIIEKYHYGDDEYQGQCFQQLLTLFDTLAKISSPRVYVIKNEDVVVGTIEHHPSGWKNNMNEVWFVQWPKAIMALPDIYDDYKEYVIKRETTVPALAGDAFQLWLYYKNNIFGKEEYYLLRNDWNKYSDIPIEVMDYIYDDEIEKAYVLLKDSLDNAFERRDYANVFRIFEYGKSIVMLYTQKDIWNGVYHSLCIYRKEHNVKINDENSFLNNVHSFEDVGKKYRHLKSLIRKVKYGVNVEKHGEYAIELQDSGISKIAMEHIIGESIRG